MVTVYKEPFFDQVVRMTVQLIGGWASETATLNSINNYNCNSDSIIYHKRREASSTMHFVVVTMTKKDPFSQYLTYNTGIATEKKEKIGERKKILLFF